MLSHFCAGGLGGIEEQGQASPSDMPLTSVRVAGHMLDRPSISTDHSVGKDTTGAEEITVVGWESK